MNFIRFLLISIITLLFCNQGNAVLNNVFFKHVSEQFHPKYLHYSPVVGQAALESGTIEKLRFSGNATKAFTSEQRREYVKDIGNDPTTRFLISLFPSPAGHLATATNALSSFGSVATLEIVAMLLNYADLYRTKSSNVTKLENDKQKKLKEINTLYIGKERAEYTRNELKNILTQIKEKKSSHEIFGSTIKITLPYKRKKMLTPQTKFAEELRKSYLKKGRKLKISQIDAIARNILKNMKESIDEELGNNLIIEGNEIKHPNFTAEQIILSFFCYNFNTKGDIWALLASLPERFLNKTPRFKNMTEWDSESLNEEKESYKNNLENCLQLQNIDLDFMFANAYIDTNACVPYTDIFFSPSGHDLNVYYNREINKFCDAYCPGDCALRTIRHFSNLILFDNFYSKFDISHICDLINPDYFPHFKEFYDKQVPSRASEDSEELDRMWHCIVDDLNYNKETNLRDGNIRYHYDKSYVLATGFQNFVEIWKKLLGKALNIPDLNLDGELRHEELIGELLEQKNWVITSIKKICNVLNPTIKEIDVAFSAETKFSVIYVNRTKGIATLGGELNISIVNKHNKQFFFSMRHNSQHSCIGQVKYDAPKKNKIDFTSNLKVLQLVNHE